MPWQRPDGRLPNQLRPIRFERDFTQFAAASVLAHSGNTKVLCTISIAPEVPKFLIGSNQGWLTAEYRMLPGATPQRQAREYLKLSGRTQEIQRLIGRSLRACLNLELLGERTITVDADVLQADAGTRTTAITGSYVALALAMERLVQTGEIARSPIRYPVAAISVGLIEDDIFLDLNYLEDVAADLDFNIVMTGNLDLIEIQGTAEAGSFTRDQLNAIIDLAQQGIQDLLILQQAAIKQQHSPSPMER